MPSAQLTIVPLVSALLSVAAWIAGLFFYRLEKRQALAIVLWVGRGLLQPALPAGRAVHRHYSRLARKMQFVLGFLLALAIAAAARLLRSLSYSGAVAATVLGTIVYGFGGWQAALILIAFFVSSSLLGSAGEAAAASAGAQGTRRALIGTQARYWETAWCPGVLAVAIGSEPNGSVAVAGICRRDRGRDRGYLGDRAGCALILGSEIDHAPAAASCSGHVWWRVPRWNAGGGLGRRS